MCGLRGDTNVSLSRRELLMHGAALVGGGAAALLAHAGVNAQAPPAPPVAIFWGPPGQNVSNPALAAAARLGREFGGLPWPTIEFPSESGHAYDS